MEQLKEDYKQEKISSKKLSERISDWHPVLNTEEYKQIKTVYINWIRLRSDILIALRMLFNGAIVCAHDVLRTQLDFVAEGLDKVEELLPRN